MRRSSVFFLLVMCSAVLWAGGGGEADVERTTNSEGYYEVTQDGFYVAWMVAGDDLNVILRCETTGWVAIGFDAER